MSGRKYFEAAGQSAASLGLPITWLKARHGARYYELPEWARNAFAAGWILQRGVSS